jgi:6-phosphogluconolactonase
MSARRGAGAELEVFPSPAALTAAAAEEFVRRAIAANGSPGRFRVALSGGSTPTALYDRLATEAVSRRIDWARVEVFFGDERCVPPDAAASNYRLAQDHLLGRVPIPQRNVHRIRGEDDPEQAAAAYEHELREAFSAPGSRFDLVLLGLGEDGHTASLFPGTAAVREQNRWVMAVAAPSMWRVTLTPAVINDAAEVVFVVAGREKAPILRRVLEGPHKPDTLPAQLIAPRAGRLRWLVDAAAAAELRDRAGRLTARES